MNKTITASLPNNERRIGKTPAQKECSQLRQFEDAEKIEEQFCQLPFLGRMSSQLPKSPKCPHNNVPLALWKILKELFLQI